MAEEIEVTAISIMSVFACELVGAGDENTDLAAHGPKVTASCRLGVRDTSCGVARRYSCRETINAVNDICRGSVSLLLCEIESEKRGEQYQAHAGGNACQPSTKMTLCAKARRRKARQHVETGQSSQARNQSKTQNG